MKRIKAVIFLVLVFSNALISVGNLRSQDVTALAKTDSTRFLIGDQFTLTLRVTSDIKTRIIFPEISGGITGFEIISEGNIDTITGNGKFTLEKNFILTCFDSGSYEIPAFTFMYEKSGMSELYPATTSPFSLYFGIPALGKDIRDIKKPLDEPVTFAEYLPWLIILAALTAVGILAYFYFKRRKPGITEQKAEPPEPKIPPHILALAALDKLKSDALWQKGALKEHYIRLSEILRMYIERRYGILALEMSSTEILDYFRLNINDPEINMKLEYIFENADLTKFAKRLPGDEVNSRTLDDTYFIVNKTTIEGNNTEKQN